MLRGGRGGEGGLKQIHTSEMIEEAGIFKQLGMHIEAALLSHQSYPYFCSVNQLWSLILL